MRTAKCRRTVVRIPSPPTACASRKRWHKDNCHFASYAWRFQTHNPLKHTNSTANTSHPEIIRGVNIGSWLILEQWMVPQVFINATEGNGTNATDQYSFDPTPGAENRLKQHWETYFTEADAKKIASWGINALRIPIGYWAYDNTGTPYIKGADAYLERAIHWARKYSLNVLVDCHGSPGSQNGFDNSGRSGPVRWQTTDNMNRSIAVLETMARKYGAMNYSDVVLGLELTNEPISWDTPEGGNNFNHTKAWTKAAYKAVRAAAANKNLLIVMHDSFQGPDQWLDVSAALNANFTTPRFAIDIHLYQNQVASDNYLTQKQHIVKACKWAETDLLPKNAMLPVFVGEFSAQTNICAYQNGTITAGSVCYEEGCYCSANTSPEYYNPVLLNATRAFLEAELDTFEHLSRGWFLWSCKGPEAWGLENLFKYGVIGNLTGKVTDRYFPNQCNFIGPSY